MENLPKAAKPSSNQSLSRTSQAKCPNNPAEHCSLFGLFFVLKKLIQLHSLCGTRGTNQWHQWHLPDRLPVLLVPLLVSSPRLDSKFTPCSVRQDVMLPGGPADPDSCSVGSDNIQVMNSLKKR